MLRIFAAVLVSFLFVTFTFSQSITYTFINKDGEPIAGLQICNSADTTKLLTSQNGVIKTDLEVAKIKICPSQLSNYSIDSIKIDRGSYCFICRMVQSEMESINLSINISKNESEGNLNPKDYTFQRGVSSSDILEKSGELYVQRSQVGGGSPVVSGFEANRILLIQDGVRLNNAIYRGGHLHNINLLDPNAYDVSIKKSSGGGPFGSDALGGVISLTTPELKFDSSNLNKQSIDVGYDFSSVDVGHKTYFRVKSVDKKLGVYLYSSFSKSGDVMSGKRIRNNVSWLDSTYVSSNNKQDITVDNQNPFRQINTGLSQISTVLKLKYKQTENKFHTLSFQIGNIREMNRFDRLSLTQNDTLQYANWAYGPQVSALAYYNYENNNKSKLWDRFEIEGSYQKYKESRHTRLYQNSIQTNRNENVDVYGLNWFATKVLGTKGQLYYGVESYLNRVKSGVSQYNVDSNTFSNNTGTTRYPGQNLMNYSGIYISANWFVKKSLLTTSIRFNHTILNSVINNNNTSFFPIDRLQLSNTNLTGSIEYDAKLVQNLRSRTSIGTSFKAPNVDDIAKVFDSNPGSVLIPNSDLKSEYVVNFRESIEARINGDLVLSVAGYYSYLLNGFQVQNSTFNGNDSIVYDGNLSQVQTNENFVNGSVYGVEGSAKLYIGKNLIASGIINTQRGIDYTNNTPLGHIPPTFGRLSLMYFKKQMGLGLNGVFNLRKDKDDYHPSGVDKLIYATENGIPSWYVINFSSQLKVNEHWQISFCVENLFDLHYRTFASGVNAPGRNFRFGIYHQFL